MENLNYVTCHLEQDTENPFHPAETLNGMMDDAIPTLTHHHGSYAAFASDTRETGRPFECGQGYGARRNISSSGRRYHPPSELARS